MHAKHPATLRTSPFSLIAYDEIIHPIILNGIQVFDHARAIFGPVAFIQMFHAGTWKLITLKAILIIPVRKYFAVLDLAG